MESTSIWQVLWGVLGFFTGLFVGWFGNKIRVRPK